MSTLAAVIGRILMAVLFIAAGFMKVGNPGRTAGMLEDAGLVAALTFPVALFEIVAGLALAIGFKTRLAALSLGAFTVMTVLIYGQFTDPSRLPSTLLHIGVVGGLLAIVAQGGGRWSYDALRHRRADERAKEQAEGRG